MRNVTMLIIAVLLLLSVNSCSPEKKAERKAQRNAKKIDKKRVTAVNFFAQHPEFFAEPCGRQFPPATFDSTSFKKGQTSIRKDTGKSDVTNDIIGLLSRATDSTRGRIIDSLREHPFIVVTKCPDCPVSTPDTFIEVRQVTNTALVEGLRISNDTLLAQKNRATQKLADKDERISEQKKTIRKLYIYFGALCLLIIIYIVVKIVKKVP